MEKGKEIAAPFMPDYGDFPVRQDQSALDDAGVANSVLSAMVLPTDLVALNEKELEALKVEGSHRAYTGLMMLRAAVDRPTNAIAQLRDDCRQANEKVFLWMRRWENIKGQANDAEARAKTAEARVQALEAQLTESDRNLTFWRGRADELKKDLSASEVARVTAEDAAKMAETEVNKQVGEAVLATAQGVADQVVALQDRLYQSGYDLAFADLGLPQNDSRRRSVQVPRSLFDAYAEEDENARKQTS